jgi:hypothetical protein
MEIDPSRYVPENLERLGVEFDPEELTRIVSLDTIDAVLEESPPTRFAELMKLPAPRIPSFHLEGTGEAACKESAQGALTHPGGFTCAKSATATDCALPTRPR